MNEKEFLNQADEIISLLEDIEFKGPCNCDGEYDLNGRLHVSECNKCRARDILDTILGCLDNTPMKPMWQSVRDSWGPRK